MATDDSLERGGGGRSRAHARFVFASPVESEIAARLRELGVEVEENGALRGDELRRAASRADVLVTKSWQSIDADVLGEAKGRLRVLVQASSGVDNIDSAAAAEVGVEILAVDPGNATSVAELTIAAMLALLRGLPGHWRRTAAGSWPDREKLSDREARGMSIGLVGIGRVGSRVAKRAAALEMRPIAYDPYADPERFERCGAVREPALERLLAQSEILSLHCPLTDETRGMIRERELALLPGSAFLLNTARGGIVDENALKLALDEGRLAGAALDVYATEPPPGGGLLAHPLVLPTPHLAGHTLESHEARKANLLDAVCDLARRFAPETP